MTEHTGLRNTAVQKGSAKTDAGMLPVYLGSLNGDISMGEFKLSTHDVRFTDVVPFGAVEPKGPDRR